VNTASILYLPPNTQGDDYIVGDLHGQYDALQALLADARFSREKDRLICVGDLVNRGPKSAECLELLRESWVHAVIGNHDLCLLWALQEAFPEELGPVSVDDAETAKFIHQFHGGKWASDRLEALSEWKSWALEAGFLLKALPSVIVVGSAPDVPRFQVVHAFLHDLVSRVYLTDQRLDALNGVVSSRQERTFSWTKEHVDQYGLFEDYPGLSKTYCGHCVVTTPQRILGHLMLDTGAGKADSPDGSKLTMICHRTQQIFQRIIIPPKPITL